MVLGNHYHHIVNEYVCFVFCRLGGRVVLGVYVLCSVDSVVEWS